MEGPITDSVKEIDKDTWRIGGPILHRSMGPSHRSTWYDRMDGFSYFITDAPVPPPPSMPLRANNSTIKLVYDAGKNSAVWSIGNDAFCKVKTRIVGTTPEATTIAFVHAKNPNFEIPRVLYQAEQGDRSYLFLSRVPGRTLAAAWPSLNETWRQRYIHTVVSVCESLQLLESDKLSGVDGKNMPEMYLIADGAKEDFSPGNLQRGCELVGMDCSTFVFYHTDLGPGNIIVEHEPQSGNIGIIDWETAGFFPRGWIRTKFRVSSGLNLPSSATDEPRWWRSEIQKLLGVRGFDDFCEEWFSWWEGPTPEELS
ncbi:uncharacterized protein N7459_008435 [Penicillium hispanicum]|uniref:uncharacterized protein n=1 Tax=Penicillium hispanicum TaxID=1080232 RepID=UPI00253FB42F|nr:uncharacterized protein N7459_008435 [Penicillium hispanicum]KAJ5574008.1 hypothetical protein N7459_008435 [Penicillium hispanicum]